LLAYNNLAGLLQGLGRLGRAHDLVAEGLQEARRFGIASFVEGFEDAVNGALYFSGHWDECLRGLDTRSGESDEAAQHLLLRALIREARDDIHGALDDARTALEIARSTIPDSSPEHLLFPLVCYVRTALAVGRADETQAHTDELTGLLAIVQPSLEWGSLWADLAVVLTALDRTSELLLALERAQSTPWVDAASSYASGDFVRAADTYATIGSLPDEAQARLRAAEALIEDGRRAEADDQLQQSLAFYRSVGATRYMRQGEALFAESA
jgi:hypothetical protein